MTYHFIITMMFGGQQLGWDSTYILKPGETRAEAYEAIVEATKERAASHGIATVMHATLFFSFEPNEISVEPQAASQQGAAA